MSKRLQVLIDEAEFHEIRAFAQREQVTVAEWVRLALHNALRKTAGSQVREKLAVVRQATEHSLPTADIDEMLREIASEHPGKPPEEENEEHSV
jgi:hypothetical protein